MLAFSFSAPLPPPASNPVNTLMPNFSSSRTEQSIDISEPGQGSVNLALKFVVLSWLIQIHFPNADSFEACIRGSFRDN